MDPLLYRPRIAYPPNKGDKIRSYHLLRFLAQHYEVHLGTFVDDESDWAHEPTLAQYCASRFTARLDPRRARVRSLSGLICGEAGARLRRFVDLLGAPESQHRAQGS